MAASCIFPHQGTRQSPTSPIEILSSRYGTQPKIFTDKKADILKIIRNENAEDNSDNGLENNNNDKVHEQIRLIMRIN